MSKIIKIRPKKILSIVENNESSIVDFKLTLPSTEIGSISVFEATMLVSLLKVINAKTVFEFGTYLGYTSRLFLNNSYAKVFTIDFGLDYVSKNTKDSDILINDIANDNYLSINQMNKGAYYLSDLNDKNKNRIELIFSDSTKYNFENLYNKIDFIFIDGGHTKEIINSDTKNAFRMLSDNGIIVWHDFNSKIHSDVSEYLSVKSKEIKIYHIENTMLAFYINNKSIKL